MFSLMLIRLSPFFPLTIYGYIFIMLAASVMDLKMLLE